MLGVPSSLHGDLRGRAFDFTEIAGSKFDRYCSDVLVQALQLRRAWDWNDPRLLRKQTSERDLSRGRLLPLCDLAKQVNQGLIRFIASGLK